MKGLEKRKKVGDVVNGWEILEIYFKNDYGSNIAYAKVRSTLGDATEKEYRLTLLNNEKVGWPDRRRPDVREKNKTHGLSYHPLYRMYNGMVSRCNYPSQISYKDYGGKGIQVCEEWMNDFKVFYDWAIENGWKPGLVLDREKSNLNYEPNNCRWVTPKENNDNRSNTVIITAFGETKTAADWSLDKRCKCSHWSLLYRIKNGWNPEKALSKPSKSKSAAKQYRQFYEWCKQHRPDAIDAFTSQ